MNGQLFEDISNLNGNIVELELVNANYEKGKLVSIQNGMILIENECGSINLFPFSAIIRISILNLPFQENPGLKLTT